MTKSKLKQIITDLRKAHPEATLYNGLGHCVYLAKLAHDKFTEAKVPSKVLIGRRFKATAEGKSAKRFAHKTINRLEHTTDDRFKPIYDNYIKRGGTLIEIGHAVVLIDNTIYDPTADQFGLPTTYPLRDFVNTWSKISTGAIEIDLDAHDDFYVKNIFNEMQIRFNLQAILESTKQMWRRL